MFIDRIDIEESLNDISNMPKVTYLLSARNLLSERFPSVPFDQVKEILLIGIALGNIAVPFYDGLMEERENTDYLEDL